MNQRLALLVAAFGAAAALTACDLAPQPERLAGSDLTRPLVEPFTDPALGRITSKPRLDAAQLKQANEILDQFFSRTEKVFLMDETDQHLDALEDFAVQTQRYFELVDAYRDAYDRFGAKHFTSPRLAWAYVNLGHMTMAGTLVDEALKARPNDARVHFVRGFLISRSAQVNRELIKEVRASWIKALSLDPELKNLYPVSAKVLRGRIEEMNRVLGDNVAIPDKPVPVPTPTPQPSSAPAQDGESPATAPSSAPADDGQPPSTEQRLLEAESLLASGAAMQAYPAFERIINDHPDNQRALYGRALAGWKAIGNMDRMKALGLLDAIAKRPDLTGRQLYELGSLYFREVKQNAKALALIEQLKIKDPEYAQTVNADAFIERIKKKQAEK